MASLFEISAEIEALIHEVVDEETGEIIGTEMDIERLNQLAITQDQRREYIAKLSRNAETDAEAYKNLKMEYAKKQARSEAFAKKMHDYLETDLNGEKWEASDKSVKVNYRNVKNKVIVDNVDDIPREYFKVKYTEKELSKTAVKDAILGGKEVIGAHLEDSISMSIK